VRKRSVIAATANQLLNQLKGLTQYDLHYCYEPDENESFIVEEIRTKAVVRIATTWGNFSDTLPWLKQKAQSDDHLAVRRAAVQELGKGWKYEPWLFELLRDRALNDPFLREENGQDNPRQLALEIIIKQYPNHPQTLPLLRDRANNDPDEQVRKLAQNKLAQLEKQKSDI